jgi:hypothetical protein
MLGGYWDTNIRPNSYGLLRMIAFVPEPSTEIVQLYYRGSAVGLFLYDDGSHNDFGAGDDVYGAVRLLDPIASGVQVVLEIGAQSSHGTYSPLWPYLVVE